MRKLIPLVLLLLAGCAAHNTPVQPPSPPNKDHLVTLTWSQSFANNKACSSTVTVSCISGFQEGTIVGTTETQFHADSLTTTPGMCTGTGDPLSCTTQFNAMLPLGAVNFYVLTTGIDQNGNAVTAANPATTATPSQVALDSASNVKGVVGP